MRNKLKSYGGWARRNPVAVTLGAIILTAGVGTISTVMPASAEMPESEIMVNMDGEFVDASYIVARAEKHKSTIVPVAKMVDLSYLNDAKLGGMAGAYFGVVKRDANGNVKRLPDHAQVDFVANLQGLWDRKLRIPGVSGATQKNAAFIVGRYAQSNPGYKGIKTFIGEADHNAFFAHNNINFTALCDKLKLNPAQCVTLDQITGKIRGVQLVAYGMTEVMPTWNGDVNYLMLDTLLRNAGETYVNSIPALGDKLMSVGFYQFTSYAVYDVERKEGASFVNQFVKNKNAKIPGSVVALEGSDHHRAAFYFVTYNMARLMKKLNEKDTAMLASGICSTSDLTQFMATAHHMPGRAISNAQSWIKGRCQKPIQAYMGSHLREYATKTKNNLEALEKHT